MIFFNLEIFIAECYYCRIEEIEDAKDVAEIVVENTEMVTELVNNEEIVKVVQEGVTEDSEDSARLSQVHTNTMDDIRYFFKNQILDAEKILHLLDKLNFNKNFPVFYSFFRIVENVFFKSCYSLYFSYTLRSKSIKTQNLVKTNF